MGIVRRSASPAFHFHFHIRLTGDRCRQFQKQLTGRVAGAAEEDDISSFAPRLLTAEPAGVPAAVLMPDRM
jgi:hypothetical protein